MYEPKFLGWRNIEMPLTAEEIEVESTLSENLVGSKCLRCKVEMVTQKFWSALSKQQKTMFKGEITQLKARGLCHSCYNRAVYQDNIGLAEFARKTKSRADFVEDFSIYKRRTDDLHKIAELMGMQWRAFEKAYYRSKRAGEIQ